MAVINVGSQYNLNKIPVLGLVPESSANASPPSSPANGQFWYDTTNHRLMVRENGAWVAASNTGVEQTANKGQAGGYASLDGSTKVPIAQIPTGTSGTTVALGNDSRFTDSRPPNGAATGDLTGSYPNPTIANLAVTDAKVAAANKDGVAGTPSMRTLGTGAQQALAGNTRLDQITAPTAAVGFNGQRLTGVAPSSSGTDAVNRNELDAARQGFAGAKDPVRVASLTNINIASAPAAIDGVTLTTGDRVLLQNQTTTTQNGIYVFNGTGAAMTRAADADATGEIQDGTTVAVSEGTDAGSIYIQNTTPSGAPGAWTQGWVKFNTGGTTYTAGNGLTLSGNDFNVVGTTNRISVAADSIDISANYVGQSSINTVGTITTGVWQGTDVAVADGGTGASTAPAARTNLGATGKYAATLGAMTAGAETTVTHNLNSTDVDVVLRNVSSGFQEILAWRVIDANTVGINPDIAYSASALRVVVIG